MAVTQGERRKAKIDNPSSIKKKLGATFDSAIGLEERSEDEETVDIVTKGAYTPKDLDRDSDTGWSIIDDATFVTELVEMDFSKDDAQRDPSVLLWKVKDK